MINSAGSDCSDFLTTIRICSCDFLYSYELSISIESVYLSWCLNFILFTRATLTWLIWWGWWWSWLTSSYIRWLITWWVGVLISGVIDNSSCTCGISVGIWVEGWEIVGVVIKNSQYFVLPDSWSYSYILESGGKNVGAVTSACHTVIYDQAHNSL